MMERESVSRMTVSSMAIGTPGQPAALHHWRRCRPCIRRELLLLLLLLLSLPPVVPTVLLLLSLLLLLLLLSKILRYVAAQERQLLRQIGQQHLMPSKNDQVASACCHVATKAGRPTGSKARRTLLAPAFAQSIPASPRPAPSSSTARPWTRLRHVPSAQSQFPRAGEAAQTEEPQEPPHRPPESDNVRRVITLAVGSGCPPGASAAPPSGLELSLLAPRSAAHPSRSSPKLYSTANRLDSS